MKSLLIVAIVFLSASADASSWSRDDKSRQAIYTVMHLMDWSQTREIARNPDFVEKNKIMGSAPSQNEVNRYFLGTLVLHYLVADMLPDRHREVFQYVTIGLQAAAIGNNYSVGVKFTF